MQTVEHLRSGRVDEPAWFAHARMYPGCRRTFELPERRQDRTFEFAAWKRNRSVRHAAMLRQASEYVKGRGGNQLAVRNVRPHTPGHSATCCKLDHTVSTSARIFVATFTLWLVAAWTVPVCCLSMSESPVPLRSNNAMTIGMPGHQHQHHHSSESDRSSQRLGASVSCTQSCQATNRVIVMSPPAKNELSRPAHAAAAPTAPLVVSTLALSSVSPPSGPPRIPVAPALQPLPLRI